VAQVPSPLSLWRYECRRSRMTGVISSQGVVSVFLLTVHGHVHHVDGASTVLGPPRGSPPCLRVPHAARARQKRTMWGRALLMTPGGLGEAERYRLRCLIVPKASPQRSGEVEFVVRA
jgi:hypothetical protein